MADLAGNNSNDILNGTDEKDRIFGLGGNDVLAGLEADDELDGGKGDDVAVFAVPDGLSGTIEIVDGGAANRKVVRIVDGATAEAIYEIVFDAGGATVTGTGAALTEGSDRVVNVETLRFGTPDSAVGQIELPVPVLYSLSEGEILANSETAGDQDQPSITRLEGGGFVVVWRDTSGVGGDSSSSGVKGQLFDENGDKVGGEFLVNTVIASSQSQPHATPLSGGGFAVSYRSGADVMVQRFDSSGARQGGEMTVSTTERAAEPQIVELASGNLLVTWTDTITYGVFTGYTDKRLWGQEYDPAGNAVGAPIEIETEAGRDTWSEHQSVAALPSGGFVVVWQQENDAGTYVAIEVFAADGSRTRRTAGGAGSETAPDVMTLPSGDFVVVWGGAEGVKAQLFSEQGSPLDDPFQISLAERFTNPSLVATAGGGFAVVWQQQESEHSFDYDIHARFFNGDGTSSGDAFVVAENAGRSEESPDVVQLASGALAVVWKDEQGDADRSGVKLRLIEPDGSGPIASHLSSTTLSETALENGTAAIAGADGALNGEFSFEILADSSGGAFTVEGDRIIVADNALLDHEAAPEVTITVRATDQLGNSHDETFTFTVSDSANESRFRESAEQQVNTSTGANEHQSSVAALADGGYVVSWTSTTAFGSANVFAQRFDADGNAAGGQFRVSGFSSGSSDEQRDSAVIGLDDGGFLIVWGSEGDREVHGKRYAADGSTMADVFPINSSLATAITTPEAASLEDGGFVVVWQSTDAGGSFDIHGQRFDADGTAVGGEFVVNAFRTSFQSGPAVTSLADGGFLVTWESFDQDGSGYGIYAKRYDADGVAVGGEFVVNTTTANSQVDASVASIADGGFVIVWESGNSVLAKRYDADGSVAVDEFEIGAGLSSTDRDPVVAALPDGGFVVTWHSRRTEDGELMEEVYAQRFSTDGSAAGDPFLVNTTTDSRQYEPSISALPDGGFVISWTSDNQDGSGGGVYSKVYSPANSALAFDDGFATDEATPISGNVLADNGAGADRDQASAPAVAAVNGEAADVGQEVELPSGALLTINADGTFDYDPNGAFDSLTAPGSGAANISATDSFTYELEGRDSATVTVTVNGLASEEDRLAGTSAGDTITGTPDNDTFMLHDGGNDTATGGDGDDGFYMGGALTQDDQLDGEGGTLDQLGLQGNYAGYVFSESNLLNTEMIVLISGTDTRFGDTAGNLYSYDLTTIDANVAAGQQLYVSFNLLQAGENVTFNGSAETDGYFRTSGGLGNDDLTGGAQDDGFYFGAEGRWGAGDKVNGGPGGDMDQLGLHGLYAGATAISFAADQLIGIEMIVLLTGGDTRFGSGGLGYSYDITMHDDNVLPGQQMVISANTLRVDETLTFDGSAETDGSFAIYAGSAADTLVGSVGDDILSGRGGADTMSGGPGSDRFLYADAAHSTLAAQDHILDFASGDQIDLSRIDAIAGGSDDAFTFVGNSAFSNTAGELRAVQSGGDWVVEADIDGDGAADLSILVTRSDAAEMLVGDFVL